MKNNSTKRSTDQGQKELTNVQNQKRIKTKRLLLLSWCLAMLWHFQTVKAQDSTPNEWTYSVGIGTAILPAYLGDDQYQAALFVNFSAQYGDWFSASLIDGIRYNYIKNERWALGPVLKFNIGRFEDGNIPSRIAGSTTTDLQGLGDIDFTVEPGVFAQLSSGSLIHKLEIRQGLGGHKGLIGEFKSEYRSRFQVGNKTIQYALGPELKMAGTNFNNAFFGISSSQAAQSDLGAYQAKAGLLSYGFNASLAIPVNTRISAMVLAGYSRLGEAAKDSNLISQFGSRNQANFGFLLNYSL